MYKLILVDDEADVREGLLSEINWEENGFQVSDVAENGREALEMVERSVPDVIVTDIRMPFMDG
jgi:two-component system response regulator YesN